MIEGTLIKFIKLIVLSYALSLVMTLMLGMFIDVEQSKRDSRKLKLAVDELKYAMSESLKLEQIADWLNSKLK